MSEKIYTIPINEAFEECAADKKLGCPFCRIRKRLEENEIGLILGASMMEPDVRIKTNEKGFCPEHFDMLIAGKNRLGLGLILESHMNQLRGELEDKPISKLMGKTGTAASKRLNRLHEDCYICERISYNFTRIMSNAVLLYGEDESFRKKLAEQPYFCLPHFKMWLKTAEAEMKKGYSEFYKAASRPVYEYFDTLNADVSWFCKKFDYRYDSEPWGNSKDAIERARKFLCGE